MKKFLNLLLPGVFLLSCKTQDIPNPVHPQMIYFNLNNAEVKFQQPQLIDINADGKTDFFFSTQFVGDPVLQRDRLQYMAHSGIGTQLLNNTNDQSPMLSNGERVSLQHKGYEWFEISAIVLAEKITSISDPVHWDGLWKKASHQFLPVQIKKNGQFYHGWIELSFDTITEKLVLHRSAISTEPGRDVRTGV
jgi:hypothetical protein